MVNYLNTWVPGNWTGVGPILPATVDNALGYYQQLKIMVAALNETRANCDNLADYTNEQLQNIVDYLNERIKDFDNAMNEFFKNTTDALDQYREDFEQFKTEMLAAYEQFTQELLARQDAFEQRIDAKIAELEGEWDATKSEWETVKAEWAALKAEWQQFKEDLLAQFEAFKEEVRSMFEDFQNQTNESLEQWKEETFQYFLGQYETIKQLLISQLPEIVQQYLPEALAGIAGVGLKYNPDTVKIDVNYGAGLAVDGDGRLFATGGGSGGTGSTVEAGQGINVQSSGSTQTIAVKLATDNPNLEFDEQGGLRATGTGSGGGDTFVAGLGIGITEWVGSKEIYVKVRDDEGILTSDYLGYLNIKLDKATDITLGGVKTGNPEDTGLEMDTDGTIRIRRWLPIDISDEQMFFDADLQNIAPSFVIDCKNKPTADSSNFVGYAKFSQNTIDTLGLPDRVLIVNWTPEQNFSYNITPNLRFTTELNEQISQLNIKFTVSKAPTIGGNIFRNGTGKIQFTWTGYEQIVELDFSVVNADMKLNASTPIKIDGQAITDGGTYTPNSLEPKQIIFVLEDGTEVQLLGDFGNLGNDSSLRLTATNDNALLTNTGNKIFYLGSKNITNGLVTLNYIPDRVGANTVDEYIPLINFNMNYSTANLDGVDVQFTNNINNYTADGTLMINLVGYAGGNFNVTTDNAQIIGIGGYGVASKTVSANTTVGLYAGRTGTANITITTSYESSFTKTIQVKVAENIETQAHVMVMSNSNTLNDTSLDIAHPANDNSSYTFSKAQGNITFWCKANPLNNIFLPLKPEARTKFKIYAGLNEILKIENPVYGGPDVLINGTYVIDFSNLAVGSELFAEWSGDTYVPYYKIKIGQVVD